MEKAYTEIGRQTMAALQKQLQDYLAEHYIVPGEGTQSGCWKTKQDSNLSETTQIEEHQAHVRSLRTKMRNLYQNDVYTFVNALLSRGLVKEAGITPGEEPKPYISDYRKIAPLVERRKFTAKEIARQVTKSIIEREDGDRFSFTEPQDIVTEYYYCNCGQFPLALDEMTEGELQLATEHLAVCQFPRIEKVVTQSHVMQHTVGNWDCKACYKEPAENNPSGISSLNWCPRFLKPFRTLDPKNYIDVLRLRQQGQRSCYGGILHRQISVSYENGKQYIIHTELCDTCGFTTTDKKEIIIPEQQHTLEFPVS